jgi:hypothetical protein
MLLRYNALVGRDPLPRIRELAAALALEVGDVGEEAPVAGKRIKSVSVRGDAIRLSELERQLQRYPAITARFVSG